MKQTLQSPLGAKKWVWLVGAIVIMVLLMRSSLPGWVGAVLTLGVLIAFIDLLSNVVLAEFEYTMINHVFVYKRNFSNREKIIFYLPAKKIVAILPEKDERLQQYSVAGTNYLIPRFCNDPKYAGIYQENGKYFRFLFIPNAKTIAALEQEMVQVEAN